jgi:hypothetical protein
MKPGSECLAEVLGSEVSEAGLDLLAGLSGATEGSGADFRNRSFDDLG